jgi:hypothetical protein
MVTVFDGTLPQSPWIKASMPIADQPKSRVSGIIVSPRFLAFGFGGGYYPLGGRFALIPHWFPVLSSALVAAILLIKRLRRFSVRTLLLATTLIAALLGIIAISN